MKYLYLSLFGLRKSCNRLVTDRIVMVIEKFIQKSYKVVSSKNENEKD